MLLGVGISDVPLRNPGVPAVLAVSMFPWATVPDRVVCVLKHLLGERALATASVIRCSLHALPIPPIYVSPGRDARTSERLGYGFRRDTLKRHDHRGERLTRSGSASSSSPPHTQHVIAKPPRNGPAQSRAFGIRAPEPWHAPPASSPKTVWESRAMGNAGGYLRNSHPSHRAKTMYERKSGRTIRSTIVMGQTCSVHNKRLSRSVFYLRYSLMKPCWTRDSSCSCRNMGQSTSSLNWTYDN